MRPAPIVFVAGLPRSGSTLLMQLLGQNPAHHVTPTSGLAMLVQSVRDRWMHILPFKTQGLDVVEPRVSQAIGGLMTNFYAQEIREKKTVFDKSRVWPSLIEVAEGGLGAPVRVILCVRDLRAILASFEKIHRKSALTRHAPWATTAEGRARDYMGPKSVVGASVAIVRDALARADDRLIVVPYRELSNSPQQILTNLHKALGLPAFKYDIENVRQVTHENDTYHGMRLHEIREGAVLPASASPPWEGMYSEQFCQQIDTQFADIQRLAAGSL